MICRGWLGCSSREAEQSGEPKRQPHPDAYCLCPQMTIWECAGRKWGLTLCVVALGWTARPPTQSAAASTARPGAWTVPSVPPRTQVLPPAWATRRVPPPQAPNLGLQIPVLDSQISPNLACQSPVFQLISKSWSLRPHVKSQRLPSFNHRNPRPDSAGPAVLVPKGPVV